MHMNNTETTTAYRGNRHRDADELILWHAGHRSEVALEPELPIVDPHHHLYGSASDRYRYLPEDLARDLGAGHRVMGTVYLEAYGSGWHEHGPAELRSLGEVEMILRATREPLRTATGMCQVAAGIVSSIDLTLGQEAADILAAHVEAAQGRLRGVRHHLTHDLGTAGRFVYNQPRDLMRNPAFRQGMACLQDAGLAFDAFLFHTQLTELAALADAFPDVPFVVDHVGTMIRVAEYANQADQVRANWERGLRALALRPNVHLKVGGLGMPIFGFGFEHAPAPASSERLAAAWQPLIDFCVDLFGAPRCMFESNFPVDKQSCGYVELWNALKLATRHRTREERRDLFHGTACRVYRLPELEQACLEVWS